VNTRLLFFLAALTGFNASQAQTDVPGQWKAGVGYTHNFPGMNGYTLAGEYIFPVAGPFEGGLGAKYIDLDGHPRTATVGEYVRAATLDFNLYWVPFRSDAQLFRVGLGYSFSFYNCKSAYPVIVQSNGKSTTEWPILLESGRTGGINLIAEYEYKIPNTPLSIGLRGALYKAYDRTYFIGPMMGYRW
jgi:hypothetical protein